MTYSLTWLPNVLEEAGLKYAECDGWQTRGHGDMGDVQGVICHHTATPAGIGNMPTLHTLIEGRPDLTGPLSQLGLGKDGTFYIVAAGKCNHAGNGIWRGIVTGNSSFIGIEVENSGTAADSPWPAVQLDACHRGVAAILKHLNKGAEYCAGHKEFALPKGRKTDPDLDMNAFRNRVTAILNGEPPPPRIPAIELVDRGFGLRATLRRGLVNDPVLVKMVQKKIRLNEDGVFGPKTEAAVRAFQRDHDAVPDGIVGPKTWVLLDTA